MRLLSIGVNPQLTLAVICGFVAKAVVGGALAVIAVGLVIAALGLIASANHP